MSDAERRQRALFARESEAWKWLQANMANEAAAALGRFININRHWQGAEWWDCLSVLRDSDAHLDILEPLAEQFDDWSVLHDFVTYTLIYSSGPFAIKMTDDERAAVLREKLARVDGS